MEKNKKQRKLNRARQQNATRKEQREEKTNTTGKGPRGKRPMGRRTKKHKKKKQTSKKKNREKQEIFEMRDEQNGETQPQPGIGDP